MHEYDFEEIVIGMKESYHATITSEMMDIFESISGDTNPLHNDDGYAQKKGYRCRVVYGMLTASLISTLAGVYLPGKNSVIMNEELFFKKPVYIGDKLLVSGEVISRNEVFRIITIKIIITNQNLETVVMGKMDVSVTV